MEPVASPGVLESGSPPDSGQALDPQEQHAAAMLERAIERAEPQPAAEPPQRELAQVAPQPRQEPTQPFRASTPPPTNLFEHPASRGFMSRVQERAAARAQAELAAKIARATEYLERQQQGVPAGAAPDPEPDFDADPKAWYQQEMARQLREAVAPLVDQVRHQQETAAQYEQRMEVQRQQAEWSNAMAGEMDHARQLYAATPEGQLFDERFDWFLNDVTTPALVATGMHPQQASEMAQIGMKAWTDYAIRQGINPAVFIDTIIRSHVASTANFLVEAGYQPPGGGYAPQNGNGNGYHRPQRQNAEIASLRETAASAGSVAGVMRQTTAGRAGSGIHAVMADPSVENIRAWANDEFGGDTKKATAALRRAVASAASAQR